MPDSLRKVLLGTLIGALVVGFAWHLAGERAKRAPASMGGPRRRGDAGRRQARRRCRQAGWRWRRRRPRRSPSWRRRRVLERLSLEVEALGTARANESIDVTAKVSNLVTAIRFTEGQQVRKGDVLVELDGEQARADLAVADAALKESASQLKRSRELYETKVLSDQQIEQIEATYAANQARVAAARSRLATRSSARRSAAASACAASASAASLPPAPSSPRSTTPARIKLDFTVPERVVAAMKPGLTLEAKQRRVPGPGLRGQGRERRFARRSQYAVGDRSRHRARTTRAC